MDVYGIYGKIMHAKNVNGMSAARLVNEASHSYVEAINVERPKKAAGRCEGKTVS